MALWLQQLSAERLSRWCLLCKEYTCLCQRRGAPTSADGLVDRMASSIASNTSVAVNQAAAAAHPLDRATVHTGTPSTGTIASAPEASTSAKSCRPMSNSASTPTQRTPTHLTSRRTSYQITPRDLSTAREMGDPLGKCRRARARLAQAFGLRTFPQSYDDALASLALYHSPTIHSGRSGAGSAVPVLSRLNSTSCTTFILAFTPTPFTQELMEKYDANANDYRARSEPIDVRGKITFP